jgi:hypothetical protein
MRLPLPFLLYVTALGLFGWAGWTVYNSLPLWDVKTREQASRDGRDKAIELLAKGKGSGQQSSDINFNAPAWWEQLKQVNLIGKLPPKQPTAAEIAAKQEAEKPKVDMTPLEDIFELVSLVYDGKDGGKGGDTHVIIRYKPTANVEPPEWWIKENTPPSGAQPTGGPRDLAAAPSTARTSRGGINRNTRGNRGNRGNPRGAQPTTMPTTSTLTGREILQKIWVDDGGNPRRAAQLWDNYGHIKLVRVAPDAQSAFFVRAQPKGEGEAGEEPKEEELLKTTADIPQEVLLALRKLQGREGERTARSDSAASASNPWREVEETTRFGNQFHIGRKDEKRFRDSGDFFNNVYVDTYVSKTSNLRGVSVRSVEPKLAQSYGIQTGDVLLEVNNRKISSKAQATNMVKKDYQRGVRTFSTKWLSNGQVVERVYQAPDKK